MPAGGLCGEGEDWLHFDKKDGFFVHYKVISRLFRKKFIALFSECYENNEITLCGDMAKYKRKKTFEELTKQLKNMEWVVNIQAPQGNPEKIVEYLSRYVFRIAISNSRIIKIEDEAVHFKMKDYRTGLFKKMKLPVDEFIRRYLLHVLPPNFLKVRYYGILANRYRKPNVTKIKEILSKQHNIAVEEAIEDGETQWVENDPVWKEIRELIRTFKRPNCPACKKGRMTFLRKVPNDQLEPG
jgi:hypothetical protein